MDVYVLRTRDGAEPKFEPAISRMFLDKETGHSAPTRELLARMKKGEKFWYAMGDTEELGKHLAHLLGRPVVDEVRDDGYYLFYFPCDIHAPDAKKVIEAVEEKYGLTLVPATRKVEVLVVTKMGDDRVQGQSR